MEKNDNIIKSALHAVVNVHVSLPSYT